MICSKCGNEKPIDEFEIRIDNGKRRNQCKGCRKQYIHKYYQKNKDILYQKHKMYKEKNKDKISQYQKNYRKKYYSNSENRKKHNEYQKERRNQYRKEHPPKVKEWTDKEIKYLQDNVKDKTYSELALDLNRSQCGLENKMRRLNIKPKLKLRMWTDEEIKYLRDNTKEKTYHELAHDLNRTYNETIRKINKLNITPKRRRTSKWTKDEINYIRKNAKDKTYPELAKELNRSQLSIERKMVRLNIKPKQMHHKEWPEDKVKYLIKNAKNRTYIEMSKDLSKHPVSIRKKMHKLNIKAKKHPKYKTVNHDFFKTWSDNMAYILGYWFADGCIFSNGKKKYNSNFHFSISSKDLEILDKFKNIMKSTYSISTNKKIIDDKSFVTYTFKVCSKEIYNDIIKLGGCERKSLVAKFPDVPDKYVRHFIRGYFDGDGCIRCNSKYKNYPFIGFLGTKNFISVLMRYLDHITKIKSKINIYMIDYCGQDAQDILRFMYKDSSLYLKRKYERYKNAMKWKRTNNLWNKDEIEILKERYPKNSWDIPKLLENHSKRSISVNACELKIKFKN